MTEKPITLRDWQVRGVLAGTITQHRVVLKPQPEAYRHCTACGLGAGEWGACEEPDCGELGPEVLGDVRLLYAPGDLLWVRETHKVILLGDCPHVWYRADNAEAPCTFEQYEQIEGSKWRPSIHMPRWASRITPRVAAVRVERVQEISREDEIAEGCPDGTFFDCVWDSINVKRPGCSWDDNPWVAALTFERVTP